MAKPSNVAKANKSHKSRSPKEGRGAQPEKMGGHSKKGREIKRFAGKDKEALRDIKKMAKGTKSKGGCLPKLFMMFLPFMLVGAYFFLNM
jgi:hypothetical protein